MRTTKSSHNGSALTKLDDIHIQRHALKREFKVPCSKYGTDPGRVLGNENTKLS